MSVTADKVKPRGAATAAVLAAILVLAAFGPKFMAAALALAAIAVALIMLLRRARTLPWRLATAAAVLWALEEIAWAVERVTGISGTSTVTEVTYYAGLFVWLVAILLMPGKRMPRSLLIAVVPAIALLVLLLFLDSPATVTLTFPALETLLVVASLPLLGGTMTGGASEGRVLVVLAFYLRALGSGSYAWLQSTGAGMDAMLLWLLSYLSLGLGVQLEMDDQHAEFVPVAVAIATLQAVSAALLIAFARVGMVASPYVLVVIILLAYVQFAVVVLALLTSRASREAATAELRLWSQLLDTVSDASHEEALASILTNSLERLPGTRGIEVHDKAALGSLEGYAYPLVTGGAEVGRLYFGQKPAQSTVLDMCTPMLAARIRLLSDRDRWAAAALSDPLTGLLNRRGLEVRSDLLVAEAQANDSPISVAMLDIDHFKRVNDVYGHAVGDEALKALAAILRQHLRPRDQAVRWGGEEFVVVLPDAEPEQAVEVLKRVRHQLYGANLSPIAWPLAVSVGIAGTAGREVHADSLRALVASADAALGMAKRDGRNRIVQAPAGAAAGSGARG